MQMQHEAARCIRRPDQPSRADISLTALPIKIARPPRKFLTGFFTASRCLTSTDEAT